jgi:hypothetical protein
MGAVCRRDAHAAQTSVEPLIPAKTIAVRTARLICTAVGSICFAEVPYVVTRIRVTGDSPDAGCSPSVTEFTTSQLNERTG